MKLGSLRESEFWLNQNSFDFQCFVFAKGALYLFGLEH